MEYHPELSGTPHVVSLGLLGKDIYRYYDECAPVSVALQTTVAMYPDLLSCASDYPRENVQIAVQPFERGSMLWVENPYYDSGTIWVIFYDGARNMLVNQSYIDMWREGLPLSDETPPPSLIAPIRGFGYVWRTYPEVRYNLGWATAPEQTGQGTAQMFRGGPWVIHRMGNNHVFILQVNGRADDIPRP
ncbi:MAG: hypothetical protein GFH27_549293n132 [Chloroflexi bacterium AL-W]|nr:hypothetical protein [Chloroflexi bacterium AL-N1]NOK67753.1 hypothetical protein [Chloroflexi bacterium AL-N10]NOK75477.1 hypothetical protein [Chloroflexi bacterium AL-N5]NOK82265.1 hypothetical protein [Chloroflexi bacterium AL-W]NOK90110.1 hypothetical protein [Chloroflexi bacterium AL-N15]